MSVRYEMAEKFGEDWAEIPALASIRVIATERGLDDIQTATALIRVKRVGRHPAAPLSHRRVWVTLTLISPHLDMDRAADELDALTEAALDYLDTRFSYEDAETVGYGDRLAVDIPLTVIAAKTAPEEVAALVAPEESE